MFHHNASMRLKETFERWVDWEIGSRASPALRQHLRVHDYRLFSCIEDNDMWYREVYHPVRGFYRASGFSEAEALLGLLRQIWLMDSLHEVQEPEAGPAS